MVRRKVLCRTRGPVMSVATALLWSGCGLWPTGDQTTQDEPKTANADYHQPAPLGVSMILTSANVITLDERCPRAEAVAIDKGKIVAVGTNAEVRALAGTLTQRFELNGATVLPGFIDPHSHMAGYGSYNDPEHWLDVSSINMYFKPAPSDPRCTRPDDPQVCFIPVQTHDDVIARIKRRVDEVRALVAAGRPVQPVLAFNYDPSRLGHGSDCATPEGLGFECKNFEDGTAREQLDAIATDIPIYVTSESGHISYVNTPALNELDICGVPGATSDCHQPIINPGPEIALAKLGQLDEDLSLYGTGYFQEKVLQSDKGLGGRLLRKAANVYAQHGYTLVQEGAAGLGEIVMYQEQLGPNEGLAAAFPVSAAMVVYDNGSADVAKTIETAVAARTLFGDNPLLQVWATKTFADGSTQGYTAALIQPYKEWFYPFTEQSFGFPQPYRGLLDVTGETIAQRLIASHAAGFPMVVHQNGDQAIKTAVDALVATRSAPPPQGKRDLVLHSTMINQAELQQVKNLDTAVVSQMASNIYYYGLPECQQVIGRDRVVNYYPSRLTLKETGRLTLHSDSPVTPPYPLFEIWVAVTRKSQQPSWYPNRDAAACPVIMKDDNAAPGDQSITVLEGLRAFTVDAAYQYGMESIRGTVEKGKYADLVVLSTDPLGNEVQANPDLLRKIRVLGTVRYGSWFQNPNASQEPIWPD